MHPYVHIAAPFTIVNTWKQPKYLSIEEKEDVVYITLSLSSSAELKPPANGRPVEFSSVAQSCLTLCDPMNHSMPGRPTITNSRSPPKPMSIKSVMSSNHLILCRPLLLLPSIFPSIRVFSNESFLHIRWPKYWSFSISPFNG